MIKKNDYDFIKINNEILIIEDEEEIIHKINLFNEIIESDLTINSFIEFKNSVELFIFIIKKIHITKEYILKKIIIFCYDFNYFLEGDYFYKKLLNLNINSQFNNNDYLVENIDFPFFYFSFKELVEYFWIEFNKIENQIFKTKSKIELKILLDPIFEIVSLNDYNFFKNNNKIIFKFKINTLPLFIIKYIFDKKPSYINQNINFELDYFVNSNLEIGILDNFKYKVDFLDGGLIIYICNCFENKNKVFEYFLQYCLNFGANQYIIGVYFQNQISDNTINIYELNNILKNKLSLLSNVENEYYLFKKSNYHRLSNVYGKSEILLFLRQCAVDPFMKNIYKYGVYGCYLIFENLNYREIINYIKNFENFDLKIVGYGISNNLIYIDLLVYDYEYFKYCCKKISTKYQYSIRSFSKLSQGHEYLLLKSEILS